MAATLCACNPASQTACAVLQVARPEEVGRLFTMFLAHPALALCLLLGHAEPEPDLLSKLQASPCLTLTASPCMLHPLDPHTRTINQDTNCLPNASV